MHKKNFALKTVINIVVVGNRLGRKVHQCKGPEGAKHIGKVMGKVSGITGLSGTVNLTFSCPSRRLDLKGRGK